MFAYRHIFAWLLLKNSTRVTEGLRWVFSHLYGASYAKQVHLCSMFVVYVH